MKKLATTFDFLIVAILWLTALANLTAANSQYSTESLAQLLPEDNQIDSWILKEPPQFFFASNLWDYIDGAADKYLAYDFLCVATAEYIQTTSPSLSIIVDIYDMGNLLNAFGIYSIERQPDYNFIPIGAEGYLESLLLCFFKDRYYIKGSTFSAEEKYQRFLLKFAQSIEKKILAPATLPAIFEKFPRANLIPHSQRFYRRNFLNIPGLHNFYTADYSTKLQPLASRLSLFYHPDSKNIASFDALLKENNWRDIDKFSYLDVAGKIFLVMSPSESGIFGGFCNNEDKQILLEKLKQFLPLRRKVANKHE